MVKRFIYIQETDGGMDFCWFNIGNATGRLSNLYGWMDGNCKQSDSNLLLWIGNAEVGEYYEHRLGIAIRLKDGE